MYVTEELARFFADPRWEAVPESIRVEAKRMVFATLGCTVGAADSEFGPVVYEVGALFGATLSGGQTVLGTSCA